MKQHRFDNRGGIVPESAPLGMVFYWRGRMWRRGKGIIYSARPCGAGIIFESYMRRRKRREAAQARRDARVQVSQ